MEERLKILEEENNKKPIQEQELNKEETVLLEEKKELEQEVNNELEKYKKKTTLYNIFNEVENDETIEKKQKIFLNYSEVLAN